MGAHLTRAYNRIVYNYFMGAHSASKAKMD